MIFWSVMIIVTLKYVLLLLRAPGFYIDVFIGVILVGAVIINTWLVKNGGGPVHGDSSQSARSGNIARNLTGA